MEYPTLITTGGAWYGPPGTSTSSSSRSTSSATSTSTGSSRTNEVAWPFLDEGVNSYARDRRAWRVARRRRPRLDLSRAPGERRRGPGGRSQTTAAHDAPIAQPAYAFDDGQRLRRARLRAHRDAPRDAARASTATTPIDARASARYARTYRFEHPGPEDLIASFGEVMGEQAARRCARRSSTKGWVDYAVVEVELRAGAEPAGIFDRDGKRETSPRRDARSGYRGVGARAAARDARVPGRRRSGARRRRAVSASRWDGDGRARCASRTTATSRSRRRSSTPTHAVLLDERPHEQRRDDGRGQAARARRACSSGSSTGPSSRSRRWCREPADTSAWDPDTLPPSRGPIRWCSSATTRCARAVGRARSSRSGRGRRCSRSSSRGRCRRG